MAAKNITLKIIDAKGVVSIHNFTTGKLDGEPIYIKAMSGVHYILSEDHTTFAPVNIILERVGEDLLIFCVDVDSADIIIEGYFKVELDKENLVIGQHENGQYYSFIPITGEVGELVYVLPERVSSVQALGGEAIDLPDRASNTADSSFLENDVILKYITPLDPVILPIIDQNDKSSKQVTGTPIVTAGKYLTDEVIEAVGEMVVPTEVQGTDSNSSIKQVVEMPATTLQVNANFDVILKLIVEGENEILAAYQANEIKNPNIANYVIDTHANNMQLDNILFPMMDKNINLAVLKDPVEVNSVGDRTNISNVHDGISNQLSATEFLTINDASSILDEFIQGGQIVF